MFHGGDSIHEGGVRCDVKKDLSFTKRKPVLREFLGSGSAALET